jgi:hypothetical protein
MGAWGTGISSNDTFADIYGEFFDLYNDGHEVSEISEELIKRNQETIKDPDDANNFWFALAQCNWETKSLDRLLLERISTIVSSDADLEVWRRLGATEGDIRKRKAALAGFLEKLQSEKPKARPRKKKVIREPVFQKGDCLAFQLNNSNYGGAVVLEASSCVGFGLNLIATTRLNQTECPNIRDFERAEILIINYSTWRDEAAIGWNYSIDFKKDKELFELAGRIDIRHSFDPHDHTSQPRYGYRGGWKEWIIEVVEMQFASEERKPRPRKKLRVKDFAKRRFW